MQNSMKFNENVSKKLTLYGFVMTIFIVLSHWTHFYRVTNRASNAIILDWLDNLYGSLGLLSLATFFMLSGFLFYYGVESSSDLKGKLLRRLVSLGIPFIVWNVFNLLFDIAYGIYKGGVKLEFKDILLGFTIAPFNAPLWYLLALLFLACLSPLILLLKKNFKVSLAVLAAVLVCSVALSSFVTFDGYWAWFMRIINYLPIYLFGAVLGMHKGELVASERYRTKNVAIVSAVLLAACLAYFVFVGASVPVLNVTLYLCMPALAWLALPATALSGKKVVYPLTVSYFVYAMHDILVVILNWLVTRKILASVDLPIVVDIIIHLVLVGVLYLVCLGVAFAARKLLPEKIYRIFAGGSAGRKLL